MAGLVTLIVIRLPSIYRWLIGLGMLVAYQLILDHFLLDLTLRSPHGGLFGSVDWAAMMILGTALADLFHGEGWQKKAYPWASAGGPGGGDCPGFLCTGQQAPCFILRMCSSPWGSVRCFSCYSTGFQISGTGTAVSCWPGVKTH